MTDSRRIMAARVVRVVAGLIFVWGLLLILFPPKPPTANGFGYVLLVLGPLVMLAARWVEPPRASNPVDSADSAGLAGSTDSGPPGAAEGEQVTELDRE